MNVLTVIVPVPNPNSSSDKSTNDLSERIFLKSEAFTLKVSRTISRNQHEEKNTA